MASSGYKISATIAQKYAPLISRSRQIEMQTSKSEFPLRREAGGTNIDLWTDGSIYPQDLVIGKPPPFRSMSVLLEYVGDGKRGLYSYVKKLCSADATVGFNLSEALREIQSLREHVRILSSATKERDRLVQFSLTKSAERKKIEAQFSHVLSVREDLKAEILNLQKDYIRSKALYEGRTSQLINKSAQDSDERLQLEVDYYIAIESMRDEHETKLSRIIAKLRRVKSTFEATRVEAFKTCENAIWIQKCCKTKERCP